MKNVIMGIDYDYNVLMTTLHVSVSKHLMDEYYTVVWANDYYYESTLYSKEEYEAKYANRCRDYFQQDMVEYNKFAQAVSEALSKGEPGYKAICKMPQKGGSSIWISISGTFTEEVMNGYPIVYTTFTDVTEAVEQRELQKQLEVQTEKLKVALSESDKANRAKSEFLSRMSHDIRTPMNAIIGMTDIAKAHLGDEEKTADCLKKISVSSQHLLGLINDVLDMSKIESGKVEINATPTSLPELMENVVTIIQPGIKQREQELSVRLKCVHHENFISDPLRLRQIFINILSNATKFTPNGGKIEMEVEELPSAINGVANLKFVFRDNGIGMEKDFLEHIFEVFTREQDSRVARTDGSGLGMAITKKLVELLQGEIRVKSKSGQGTEFIVTLPLEIDESDSECEKFPDLKILLADDDVVMCEYTLMTLKKMGITAECAQDGYEALEMIQKAEDGGAPYAAVILDWKMPRLNGLETTRIIRQKVGRELPVLIVSAYDWSDIEKEAVSVGVTGFLSKPVFASSLCRCINLYVLGKKDEKSDSDVARENLNGRRFLLVEDNEMNREIAVELLSDVGAKVETAANGAEGLAAFEASFEGYYDMILMDIQMPVMNGYTAAKAIRALKRGDAGSVPILAMTADAFSEDIRHAKEVGMDGHIAKPLDSRLMFRTIAKLLKKQSDEVSEGNA